MRDCCATAAVVNCPGKQLQRYALAAVPGEQVSVVPGQFNLTPTVTQTSQIGSTRCCSHTILALPMMDFMPLLRNMSTKHVSHLTLAFSFAPPPVLVG